MSKDHHPSLFLDKPSHYLRDRQASTTVNLLLIEINMHAIVGYSIYKQQNVLLQLTKSHNLLLLLTDKEVGIFQWLFFFFTEAQVVL